MFFNINLFKTLYKILLKNFNLLLLVIVSIIFFSSTEIANIAYCVHGSEYLGRPWQMDLIQPAGIPAIYIYDFHHKLMTILVGIGMMTFYVLFRCIYLFSYKRNTSPISFDHSSVLEIVWTLLPGLVIFCIGTVSIDLLKKFGLKDIKLKQYSNYPVQLIVIGHQWYWEYAYDLIVLDSYFSGKENVDKCFKVYSDISVVSEDEEGNKEVLQPSAIYEAGKRYVFGYSESRMITDVTTRDNIISDLFDNVSFYYLLSTDYPVFLPAFTDIEVWATSTDVIHSWAVPSLGIKLDAIPGKINYMLFNGIPGYNYGQCSELCGVNHGFMPIEVVLLPRVTWFKFVALLMYRDSWNMSELSAIDSGDFDSYLASGESA